MSSNERFSPVLEGPAGNIEVSVEKRSATPTFIGIICHPHPLHGGTMNNKVVTTLARAVRDAQGLAVRFNVRVVGQSAGDHGQGLAETEDLLAVIHWARSEYPGLPLWLAGFSFGAFVAARGAFLVAEEGRSAAHLMLVAPAVHHYPYTELGNVACAVTVAMGDEDEVVPPQEVHTWVANSPWRPALHRFPQTTHFFHGQLPVLKALAESLFP